MIVGIQLVFRDIRIAAPAVFYADVERMAVRRTGGLIQSYGIIFVLTAAACRGNFQFDGRSVRVKDDQLPFVVYGDAFDPSPGFALFTFLTLPALRALGAGFTLLALLALRALSAGFALLTFLTLLALRALSAGLTVFADNFSERFGSSVGIRYDELAVRVDRSARHTASVFTVRAGGASERKSEHTAQRAYDDQ